MIWITKISIIHYHTWFHLITYNTAIFCIQWLVYPNNTRKPDSIVGTHSHNLLDDIHKHGANARAVCLVSSTVPDGWWVFCVSPSERVFFPLSPGQWFVCGLPVRIDVVQHASQGCVKVIARPPFDCPFSAGRWILLFADVVVGDRWYYTVSVFISCVACAWRVYCRTESQVDVLEQQQLSAATTSMRTHARRLVRHLIDSKWNVYTQHY